MTELSLHITANTAGVTEITTALGALREILKGGTLKTAAQEVETQLMGVTGAAKQAVAQLGLLKTTNAQLQSSQTRLVTSTSSYITSLTQMAQAGSGLSKELQTQALTIGGLREKVEALTKSQRDAAVQNATNANLISLQNKEFAAQAQVLTLIKAKTDESLIAEKARTQALLRAKVATGELTAAEARRMGGLIALTEAEVSTSTTLLGNQRRIALEENTKSLAAQKVYWTERNAIEAQGLTKAATLLSIQRDSEIGENAKSLAAQKVYWTERNAIEAQSLVKSAALLSQQRVSSILDNQRALASFKAYWIEKNAAEVAGQAKTVAASKAATTAANELHSAMRGAAGASGALWTTYGAMIPLITSFAAVATAIKTVKLGSEFEFTTKYTQSVAEATSDYSVSLGELRTKMLSIKDVVNTPEELAASVKEMVKAGQTEKNALTDVATLSKAAAVAQEDLGLVTKTTSTQFLAWNEQLVGSERGISSLAQGVNMISYAAVASATDFAGMSAMLGHTSAMASTTKISFSELLAALATLSNMGLRGTTAATSLRTAIAHLENPVGSVGEKLTKLGYSAFTAEGQLKNLPTLFGDLGKVLNSLTEKDRVELLFDIFKLRGMEGGVGIVNAMNKSITEGKFSLIGMEEQIRKVGKEMVFVEKTFGEMSNTTKVQLSMMLVDVKRVMTEAFDGATLRRFIDQIRTAASDGSLRALVDGLAKTGEGLLWAVTKAVEFKEVVVGLGAAWAATKIVAGIGKLVEWINLAVKAQWSLNIAMTANPVGLVIAALAGVTAAATIYLSDADNMARATSTVGNSVDYLKTKVSSLYETIKNAPRNFLEGVVADLGKSPEQLRDENLQKIMAKRRAKGLSSTLDLPSDPGMASSHISLASIAAESKPKRIYKDTTTSTGTGTIEDEKKNAKIAKAAEKAAQAVDFYEQRALQQAEKAQAADLKFVEAGISQKKKALDGAQKAGLVSQEDYLNQSREMEQDALAIKIQAAEVANRSLAERMQIAQDAAKRSPQDVGMQQKAAALEDKLVATQETIDQLKAERLALSENYTNEDVARVKEYTRALKGVSDTAEDLVDGALVKSAFASLNDGEAKLALDQFQNAKELSRKLEELAYKKAGADEIAETKRVYGLKTAAIKESYRIEQQLRGDWIAGAKKGFADYVYALKDSFGQAQALVKGTFESVGNGVTSSIGTTLKYMVHGLSDAKDALADSREDSIAASDKANQEELTNLEQSYRDGTKSTVEYEADKAKIQQNYLESRQKIQEDYNKGISEAEKKLGTDLKAIWTGVLDSMLDSAAKMLSDMAMKFAMEKIVVPLALSLVGEESDLGKMFGGMLDGPSGNSGDPIHAWVDNMSGGMGSNSASSGANGDFSSVLGVAGGLANLFEGGTGWDGAATNMSDNMTEALNSVDFSTSMDNAANAFGTTTSAWDKVGENIGESFTSTADDYFKNDFSGTYSDALSRSYADTGSYGSGTLDSINSRDMLGGTSLGAQKYSGTVAHPASESPTFMGQAKPYLQGASAAMAAYGAYNQFKQGNYVGGAVSSAGAASSAYQAYHSYTGTAMGSTGGALVGGAGVVGGVYGMYNGIQSMLKNGVTLQNGLSTALSAYSTYTSGMAAYAALTGTTYTSAMSAAMSQAGTYLSTALTSATTTAATTASTAATTAATHAATTTAVGSSGSAAAGSGGGSSAAGGIGGGGTAAVAFLAYKFGERLFANQERGIQTVSARTSNGGEYSYGSDMDAHFKTGYEAILAGTTRASSDIIKDGLGVSSALSNFRGGIDVLTNQFDSSSSRMYRAMESRAMSLTDYASSISHMPVSAAQGAAMGGLADQAARGDKQALALLKEQIQGLGVESFAASDAAAAMVSALHAQKTGFRTSTVGIQELNATTDQYVDKVSMLDVGLKTSSAMHDSARLAMEAGTRSSAALESQFKALGMSERLAKQESEKMVKAVGMGTEGLKVLASGAMESVPQMKSWSDGYTTMLDKHEYAVKKFGKATADTMFPLASATKFMNGAAGASAGLAFAMNGIAGVTANATMTLGAAVGNINAPMATLNKNFKQFSWETTSLADRLKLISQGYAMPGVSPHAFGGVVGYAGGGILAGGSGVADDLYLGTVNGKAQMAMGGEYIMPQEQTAKYLPILQAMNANRYANGGQIPGATDPVLSDLQKILRPFENITSGLLDYAQSVQELRIKYADATAEARKLRASESQLTTIRAAQELELDKLARDHAKSIDDMLDPYRKINLQLNDYESSLYDLKNKYVEALAAGQELGMSEANLSEIRKAQSIEIANLKRESIKEENYATRQDYNRALYTLPSFAVGTDYVPRDMIAQIHQGERITPARFNQRADESTGDLLREIQALRRDNQAMAKDIADMKRTNKKISDITEKSDAIGPAPARAVA